MTWLAVFTFVCRGCTLARSVRIEAPTQAEARRIARNEFPEAIRLRVVCCDRPPSS